MARRHKHEEHANHEAWAIPYGDLITLLLAFFVVMYAVSSVNEGKYRVLSDSLSAAFSGAPRSFEPVQVGEKQRGGGADLRVSLVQQAMLQGQPRAMLEPKPTAISAGSSLTREQSGGQGSTETDPEAHKYAAAVRELDAVAKEVEASMAGLIRDNLIAVRRHATWVEVEIRTDILFPSGVATLSPAAVDVLQQLALTLKPFPNPIRVEGHTDNRPISTRAFPSNWELSSARAAGVVHLFMNVGLDPTRLAVIGLGEHRPAQSNDTPEGRNANRRVLLIILSGDSSPEGDHAGERGQEPTEKPAPAELQQPIVAATPAGDSAGTIPITSATVPASTAYQ